MINLVCETNLPSTENTEKMQDEAQKINEDETWSEEKCGLRRKWKIAHRTKYKSRRKPVLQGGI